MLSNKCLSLASVEIFNVFISNTGEQIGGLQSYNTSVEINGIWDLYWTHLFCCSINKDIKTLNLIL